MTLLDPSHYDPAPLLLMDTVHFPEVLAVPERRAVEGGDLLTFRFANGYGAAVTRMDGCALLHAFGSAKGVGRASVVDLVKVAGVNQALAERIHAFFHKA